MQQYTVPRASISTGVHRFREEVPAWWSDDLATRPAVFRFPIEINGSPFRLWEGEILSGRLIAIDTETELIQQGEPPPALALTTVFDDQGSGFFLHAEETGPFLERHSDRWFVAQNAPFDFWVLIEHFTKTAQTAAQTALWDLVRDGRLLDTLILDQLLGSARFDLFPRRRNLGDLAHTYAPDVPVDKEDPYRLRYGELVGIPREAWDRTELGFFTYAGRDPIATLKIFQEQARRSREQIEPFADELLPGAWKRFGPLTCSLQVQGAIALDYATKRGLAIDLDHVRRVHAAVDEALQQRFVEVDELFGEQAFQRSKKTGEILMTESGVPRRKTKEIKLVLDEIADEHRIVAPRLKDGTITDSRKFWEEHRELDPRLDAYVGFQEQAKLSQFFEKLEKTRIFPRYNPYLRTGRTGCSDPNLQQLPRLDDFRRMIIADPDHWLMQIDYSAIELRTLAQICLKRYGHSRLAEIFLEGGDPHSYAAAKILGLTPVGFANLEDDKRKHYRQRAKAANFGFCGGLGARSFTAYAKAAYRVEISLDEARDLRAAIVEDVFPELNKYLAEDTIDVIASNLWCPAKELHFLVGRDMFAQIEKIRIALHRWDENEFTLRHLKDWPTEQEIEQVYRHFERLCKDPKLREKIVAREAVGRYVFNQSCVTLTGRKRGHVTYTQYRNTPFQGLAADGAKIALFELLYRGYPVAGFVHDEVLIQIPKSRDLTQACEEIETIMIESMKQVVPDVPIACEYLVGDRWYKSHPDQPRDALGRIVPYLGD